MNGKKGIVKSGHMESRCRPRSLTNSCKGGGNGSTLLRRVGRAAALASILVSTGGPVSGNTGTAARQAVADWSEDLCIERPWVELTDAEQGKERHRGALAYVCDRLQSDDIPGGTLSHVYQDLEDLLNVESKSQLMGSCGSTSRCIRHPAPTAESEEPSCSDPSRRRRLDLQHL